MSGAEPRDWGEDIKQLSAGDQFRSTLNENRSREMGQCRGTMETCRVKSLGMQRASVCAKKSYWTEVWKRN